MAVRTRIQPLSQSLSIIVRDSLSPAARSKVAADFARDQLRQAQAQNARVLGREPEFQQFVDGSAGKPLEQVNPDRGRIIFEFDIAQDIVPAILAALESFSPVLSGAYRKSHMLFADGRQVLPGEPVPAAQELVFLNPLPYSRKIEMGKMKMKVSGTDAVYQQAQRAAASRFGNIANIRFSYRSPIGTAQTGKAGRASRVPAIVVVMR